MLPDFDSICFWTSVKVQSANHDVHAVHFFLFRFLLYLTGLLQEEVVIDASVVRSGRNLSVIALELKLKKTGHLVYTARATFYHTPVAKL